MTASYLLECQHSPRKRWWRADVSTRGAVAHLPSLREEAERLLARAREARVNTFRVRIKESDSGRVVYSAGA